MLRLRLPILRRDPSTCLPMQALRTQRFPWDRSWRGAMLCQMPSLDTQQRFARRIKDGKVCHTLLPTLNRFERVSNSPTQGKELKANPDVLDLLRNRVPDNRHVPLVT